MASRLVNFTIIPVTAERVCQFTAAQAGGFSLHLEDFVPYQAKANRLRLGSIEEESFDRLCHIRAQFTPGVALSHDVFARALGDAPAVGLFGNVKHKFAVMGFVHGSLP
jgi:hypothetical protein